MPLNFKQLFSSLIFGTVAMQLQPAMASNIFDHKEVEQDKFALMATPYNGGYAHQLTVLGQIDDATTCWEEKGQFPTIINPLLLEFDFSNLCSRGTDGNGYSIRLNDSDAFTRYTPKIIEKDGELQLIAAAYRPDQEDMLIARSQGTATGFSKLIFEPGWRLTQRVFEDKVLGHFYLTHNNESQLAAPSEAQPESLAVEPASISPESINPENTAQASAAIESSEPVSRSVVPPANPSLFSQHEIDPNSIALMATPYSGGYLHQLTVLEQLSDEQACWQEVGNAPVVIDPLLLEFDFSGICRRGTDGNGYSIRVNGEDLFSRYSPKIVTQDGELQLVAHPNRPNDSGFVIARSHGTATNFSKLKLEPGWRVTKRGYEGKALGHFYLTNDSNLASLLPGTNNITAQN